MTKEGTLFYDRDTGRYDVCFDDGDHYGGLHCGNTFEAYIGGEWIPTRIEYAHNDGWYIVGHIDISLDKLRIRM